MIRRSRAKARPSRTAIRLGRTASDDERRKTGQERGNVQAERGRDTRGGNHQAGDHGARDGHNRAAQPLQSYGGRQPFARDEARERRRSCRLIHCTDAGGRERDNVEGPHGRIGLRGKDGQSEAANGEQGLRDHQQAAPVHGVRDGAAAEGEDEDRHELDEGHQADRQRVVRELPQLERKGYDRHLAPEAAHDLPEPDHSEVAVALDGLEVYQEAA
jgi:hypothetical protein